MLLKLSHKFKRLFKHSNQLNIWVNFRLCSTKNDQFKYVPDKPMFPGSKSDWTQKLEFVKSENYKPIPVYRVINREGHVIEPDLEPNLSQETLIKMYKGMILLNTMDRILHESQRQGRISFYMTNYGEEGTHFGSSAALKDNDIIYGQYRETGKC